MRGRALERERSEDEERRRLADDLHDDPIQKLTAATVRLGHLRRLVGDGEAARLLDEVEATASAAIARLRALQFDLRPRALDRPGGLREALLLRLEDLHDASGIEVDLMADVSRPISPATRTIAYRILAEALSNVQKHSGAARVRVMLATASEGLSAVVEDDGVGFDAAAEGRARHIGLASMRERAEAAGGAWWAASAPGRGTKIHLWLPDEDPPVGS
jgi:signal transduction histidine kinase